MMSTQRSFSRRMNWFLLALALWSTLAMSVVTRQAIAADDKAAAAAPAEAGKEQVHQTKSYFVWFIESSGLIGLVLLGLSIYFVATISRLFFEMRMPMAGGNLKLE